MLGPGTIRLNVAAANSSRRSCGRWAHVRQPSGKAGVSGTAVAAGVAAAGVSLTP
jgi:hypothetical protein